MVLRLTPRSPRRRIRLVTVIGELTACGQPGWARNTSADLTPATDARTTRLHRTPQHRSSACRRSLTSRKPALRPHFTRDAAASTASRPHVRDDGQRPSFGPGWRGFSPDLGLGRSGLFLRRGLDAANRVDAAEEIRAGVTRRPERLADRFPMVVAQPEGRMAAKPLRTISLPQRDSGPGLDGRSTRRTRIVARPHSDSLRAQGNYPEGASDTFGIRNGPKLTSQNSPRNANP